MHVTGLFLCLRFKPIVADPNEGNILCSENTAVVQVSLFQYIGLAVALSTGPPYRRPVYTNRKCFLKDVLWCAIVHNSVQQCATVHNSVQKGIGFTHFCPWSHSPLHTLSGLPTTI